MLFNDFYYVDEKRKNDNSQLSDRIEKNRLYWSFKPVKPAGKDC